MLSTTPSVLLVATAALLCLSPALADGKDNNPANGPDPLSVTTLFVPAGGALSAQWSPPAGQPRGYQAWELKTTKDNQCVYVCFRKLILRNADPYGDFLDIYTKNKVSAAQTTIEGTLNGRGSIESANLGARLYLTDGEACCDDDRINSTLETLPIYQACSNLEGGGMSVQTDSAGLADNSDAGYVAAIDFVYADSAEALVGQGCPNTDGGEIIE